MLSSPTHCPTHSRWCSPTFLPQCLVPLCLGRGLLSGLQLVQEGAHVEGLRDGRPLRAQELLHHLEEEVRDHRR